MNIYRLMHGLFHTCILPLISALFLSVEGWWQGQYEKGHVLIYSSHILPGQITCYCPRKRLLPQRQITRRKLCFYYTCKFSIISIKYVIRHIIIVILYKYLRKQKSTSTDSSQLNFTHFIIGMKNISGHSGLNK